MGLTVILKTYYLTCVFIVVFTGIIDDALVFVIVWTCFWDNGLFEGCIYLVYVVEAFLV